MLEGVTEKGFKGDLAQSKGRILIDSNISQLTIGKFEVA